MSMNTLTIIQILEVLAAYTLITLLLPWVALKNVFAKFTIPEQIMGYFLAGNFYTIYLVFLLQFLHISGRVTLILGTIIPFVVLIYKKLKGHILELLEDTLVKIRYILSGEIGVKTLLFGKKENQKERFTKAVIKRWMTYIPDLALTALIIAGVCYVYGKNAVTVYGYKASDMPVHTYWVNLMDENHIFGAGVYPHGFHCMIYYLHVTFGFKTYVVMRVFGFVQTIFIHLAILVPLRGMCKNRYTPYLGTAIYLFGNFFSTQTYSRYASTLPQEYGMLFIFPTAYFAIAFFQKYAAVLTEKEEEQKCRIKESKWYLLGLVISFSLTLTVHFYNTMIAGVLCVGVAIGYFFRCFRWKYLKQLIIAALLSIVLAVAPMAIGVAMGNPLQGSLYWGMNVIKGTANENGNLSTKKVVVKDKNGNKVTVVGDVDEETIEKIKNSTVMTESDGKTPLKPKVEKKTKMQILKEKVKMIFSQTQSFVLNGQYNMTLLLVVCVVAGTILGMISVLFRRIDYGGMIWTFSAYTGLMFLMQCMGSLGLPALMDPARNSIFFAYSIGILLALDIDAVLYLLFGWMKKTYVMNLAAFAVLVVTAKYMWENNLYKEPIKTDAFEMNEAITCLTNIIKSNEKNTWTICSANDETQMVYESGYHYETITFLKEMRKIDKNPVVKIPTNTVYFFIEKEPLNYAKAVSANEWKDIKVSKKYAEQPLCLASGLTPYQRLDRAVTMSHMYYWAQEFMKLYPNVMDVYYETDRFVCYKVSQNGYNLYNFAINYGYNDPVQKITTKTQQK